MAYRRRHLLRHRSGQGHRRIDEQYRGTTAEDGQRTLRAADTDVTLDDEGKPKVTFGVSRSSSASLELEQVLAAPAQIAARGKRRVVVVFDEIQRILEYESDKVERQLRSIVQARDGLVPVPRQSKASDPEDVPGPLTTAVPISRPLPARSPIAATH